MTDQKKLMAVCGHMDQIAGVRQMEFLKPFEKHVNRIRFQILDGEDEIELLEDECREVLECTM